MYIAVCVCVCVCVCVYVYMDICCQGFHFGVGAGHWVIFQCNEALGFADIS